MIIYYLGMLDTNNIYHQQNNGNILYRLYCFTLIFLHHHVSSAQWCIYCINYRGFIITFRRNCWYITFHYCYIIVKARYIARCLFGTTNGSSCIMQIPDVCFHTMWNYLFITVHLNDTKSYNVYLWVKVPNQGLSICHAYCCNHCPFKRVLDGSISHFSPNILAFWHFWHIHTFRVGSKEEIYLYFETASEIDLGGCTYLKIYGKWQEDKSWASVGKPQMEWCHLQMRTQSPYFFYKLARVWSFYLKYNFTWFIQR